MSVLINMLQTRLGEDGTLWVAGTNKRASASFAAMLIGSNLATGLVPRRPEMSARSRRLGNFMTKGMLGKMTTVATGGVDHTTSIQQALEAHYDAVQLIIPNPVTSDITGVKAKVSAGGAAGTASSSTSIAPSDGAWGTITVGGSSTFTLPAGNSVDDPSWTVTDLLTINSLDRTDGGMLPIFLGRILIPAANANRPAWNHTGLTTWETEASVAGRIFRCRTQAIDGVTTLGNMTIAGSASDYGCVPFYVRYASRVTGLSIVVPGDSIYEGAGATHQRGWQHLAQAAISTPAVPVEFCTIAIGGSNSTTWRTRLERFLASVKTDYALIPGFEPNDTAIPMTVANLKTMRGNIERARAVASEYGVVPLVSTGIPASATGSNAKAWASSDSLRRDLNDERREVLSANLVADFDAAVAGTATEAGQVEFASGLTDDGLHPNDAGHSRISRLAVEPMLRGLLTANGLA